MFAPPSSPHRKSLLSHCSPAQGEHGAVHRFLQRVNMVVPVGMPHMYHVAMQSKTCKLTVVGEHYRHLVAKGLI